MAAAQPPSTPFIVLSDSTLQYLLWMDGSGKSYEVETVDNNPLHQAVICPGASLVMPRPGPVRTPPVLEVLAWHFIRVLGEEQPFPADHGPLISLLKKYYYSNVYVRLIPLRASLAPSKQGAYDWLADVRHQYGLAADDLSDQTIMSLQGDGPNLIDQLYTSKDCHFRPAIAEKAIGLLLGRARDAMRRSRPTSVHILVVCSWNVKGDSVHQEMHATAELCQAKALQEVGSIAARHSHKQWILRRYLETGAMDRPMPKTAFQTYIHDDMPGPREIFKDRLSDFERTFCDDEALFTTLTLHAGDHGAHLCSNLKQPAHRADIFRYIYHYTHGGLYIDINFDFKVTFDNLMQILARDWGSAQQKLCEERGLGPTQEGKLPPEFLLMAIGIKKDHIFQGIIYGQPKHPLFMRAIVHAFSKEIFTKIANLEYMIFCKALWRFLRDDVKQDPAVGWNISPYIRPGLPPARRVQLGTPDQGGLGQRWPLLCHPAENHRGLHALLGLAKGLQRRPACQRAQSDHDVAGPSTGSGRGSGRSACLWSRSGGGGELICDDVQASVTNNTFEEIMEAVKQEQHYGGISSEDVMRCIPRGMILHPSKPGWLSCRHCRRNGKLLEFPSDHGVLTHFARGGIYDPAPPPSPWSAEAATDKAQPPPLPNRIAKHASV